jgi:hypothetical protein
MKKHYFLLLLALKKLINPAVLVRWYNLYTSLERAQRDLCNDMYNLDQRRNSYGIPVHSGTY